MELFPAVLHAVGRSRFESEDGSSSSAETEELELAILQQRPELEWTGPESIAY
jgi:hypothetical protein